MYFKTRPPFISTMRLQTLIALPCILLAFMACDKSKDELPGTQPGFIPKLSKIAYYEGASLIRITTIQYDTQGRLIKMELTNWRDETYHYGQDIIIREASFLNSEDTEFIDTLQLNNDGLVIFDPRDGSNYEYTSEGYRQRQFASFGDYSSTISNGNTTLTTNRDWVSQNIISTNEYTFLPDKLNTIGSENVGITFYGKQDKNLLYEDTFTYLYGGRHDQTIHHYSYEFDDKNRVKKKMRSDGIYWLYTYAN